MKSLVRVDAIIEQDWEVSVSEDEVRYAIFARKQRSWYGYYLKVPVEVLRNEQCITFLTQYFTICIHNYLLPLEWKKFLNS